VLFNDVV